MASVEILRSRGLLRDSCSTGERYNLDDLYGDLTKVAQEMGYVNSAGMRINWLNLAL